jgi:hypothetical protein
MKCKMKNHIPILLIIFSAAICLADDLVTSLDAAWNRHDYPACRRLIQNALQVNPSNMTARVALAAYHAYVEFELAEATNSMPKELLDLKSKSGKLAVEVMDVWRAVLSVPMDTPPTEQQKELGRRDLFPTNYPETELLLLLQQQKMDHGANQASQTIGSEASPQSGR